MGLLKLRIQRKSTGIHESSGDRLFLSLNTLFLLVILLVVLYPIIYIVSASFSDPAAVTAGEVTLLPVRFTLIGYEKIIQYPTIVQGFLNSAFYVGVGSIVNVAMTILAAYPLSRRDLPGHKLLGAIFFFPLLFSGGLIPFYLVVRDLGLINTRWALIIPTALSIWNVLITVSFFRTAIPEELFEAAQLDGCSDFQYLLRVVLPLSGSIIAILFLFYGVWHWNEYFNALIFLRDQSLFPLQLVMRDILILGNMDMNMLTDIEQQVIQQALKEQLKFTVLVVSTLPVLLAYPLVQKYFVKGITLGAVKG